MDDILDTIINENEFRHGEIIYFMTNDWILFDIFTVHDGNAGVEFEDITYKEVFECINAIEDNRNKFSGIKIRIQGGWTK